MRALSVAFIGAFFLLAASATAAAQDYGVGPGSGGSYGSANPCGANGTEVCGTRSDRPTDPNWSGSADLDLSRGEAGSPSPSDGRGPGGVNPGAGNPGAVAPSPSTGAPTAPTPR